jgi:acetylornithine deacetylase
MQTRWPAAAIEWQELSAYPALRDEKRSEWLKECICQLTGNKHECTMSFGTEGGLFQRFGVPTVVCGPGSIEQAHKADEYIEVGQLEQCLTLLSTMQSALREQLVRSGHRL